MHKNISPGMGIYVFLSRKEVFVINFYFTSLDSKQIASLQIILQFKNCIVMWGSFTLWHNLSVRCSGFKYCGQIRFGQTLSIFCSDHFWSCKYSFNIPYPFLIRKRFMMFFSFMKTRHMCLLKILHIVQLINLNLN